MSSITADPPVRGTHRRSLVKASILGIAGIALLVGGGTFALWYDQANLSGGAINAGELDLTVDPAQGAWEIQNGPVTIGSYLIVPGDVLTLTQPVTIVARGDELAAEFSFDFGDVAGDPALLGALEFDLGVAAPPAGLSGGPDVYTVDGTLGEATFDVEVTVTFPPYTDAGPGAADRSNFWALVAPGRDGRSQLDQL